MVARIAICCVTIALAACETTNGSDWNGPADGTGFDQAEETCETQLEFVHKDETHQRFFVDCMAAFGWRPKAGTTFADPSTAPDPD